MFGPPSNVYSYLNPVVVCVVGDWQTDLPGAVSDPVSGAGSAALYAVLQELAQSKHQLNHSHEQPLPQP